MRFRQHHIGSLFVQAGSISNSDEWSRFGGGCWIIMMFLALYPAAAAAADDGGGGIPGREGDGEGVLFWKFQDIIYCNYNYGRW